MRKRKQNNANNEKMKISVMKTKERTKRSDKLVLLNRVSRINEEMNVNIFVLSLNR